MDMVKMVGCPREGDPMEHMDEFLNGEVSTLSGYKMDGLDKLKDTVLAELAKREPDSRTVVVDRDWLYDNHVDFQRDLKKAFDAEMAKGGRVNFIVYKDLPVIDWQMSLEGMEPEKVQVYYFTNACLQIPCCYRLVQRNRRLQGTLGRFFSGQPEAAPRFQLFPQASLIAWSIAGNVASEGTTCGGYPSSVSLSAVGAPMAATSTLDMYPRAFSSP